jgi:hypothetical protein
MHGVFLVNLDKVPLWPEGSIRHEKPHENCLSVLNAIDAAKSSGVMMLKMMLMLMLMLGCSLVGIFLKSGASCDNSTIIVKQPSIGMSTKKSGYEE